MLSEKEIFSDAVHVTMQYMDPRTHGEAIETVRPDVQHATLSHVGADVNCIRLRCAHLVVACEPLFVVTAEHIREVFRGVRQTITPPVPFPSYRITKVVPTTVGLTSRAAICNVAAHHLCSGMWFVLHVTGVRRCAAYSRLYVAAHHLCSGMWYAHYT